MSSPTSRPAHPPRPSLVRYAVRGRAALASAALLASGGLLVSGLSPAGATPQPTPEQAPATPEQAPTTAAERGTGPTTAPAPTPTPTPAPAPRKRPRKAFTFDLATYNILGSQHTRGRGGYGPGTDRARLTAREIKRRGLDVVGLQEVQRDQHAVLRKQMPGYRIWPGTSLGNQGIRLQIAWRKRQFALERTGHIMTRFHRQTRPVPWVELRNRNTDRTFFVIDIHNSPRGLEGERDSATRKEIRLIKRLRRHVKPVFVVGDMNEKAEWYCKVTRRTDLHAANGGNADARRCRPPRRQLRIDWIMGGRLVEFSRYRESRSGRLRRASDHRLVSTRVHVLPPHRSR